MGNRNIVATVALLGAGLPASVLAQEGAQVVAGETCPAGTTHVTLAEVEANRDNLCRLLGSWYIVRLAAGASFDGPGYRCQSRPNDGRGMGHSLCKTAVQVADISGEYQGVHPHWRDRVTLRPDGSYARGNGDPGRWTFDGTTLVLAWKNWGPETLTKTGEGQYRAASNGFTLTLTRANQPVTPPPGLNLAKGARVRQSSLDFGGNPERAVDGNPSGNWGHGSITHTRNQPGAWLEVDLGALHQINRVILHNRTDCCAERILGVTVELSLTPCDQPRRNVSQSWKINSIGPMLPWEGQGEARYVCVRHDPRRRQFLSVAELEVFGSPLAAAPEPEPPLGNNVARAAMVRQSSVDFGGHAQRAIDGNTSGNWGHGSVTHTGNRGGEWLEINLGQPYELQKVVIHNRTDCCVERILGVQAELSLGPCDQPQRQITYRWEINQTGAVLPVTTNARAQFICLRHSPNRREYLSVAEVEAYGVPVAVAPIPPVLPVPVTIPPVAPVAPPVGRDCGLGADDPGCSQAKKGKLPLDGGEFLSLVKTLEKQNNEIIRQEMFEKMFKDTAVTARQMGKLLTLFNNEITRFEVATFLAPWVVNPRAALEHADKFNNAIYQGDFVELMTGQN